MLPEFNKNLIFDMAVKIRLARRGAKKHAYYHIVVASSRSPRNGKFIEKIGTYNPNLPNDDKNRITLDSERTKYWLKNGAQPTDRVEKFLQKLSIAAS